MEEQMPRTGAPIAALALAALVAASVAQAQEWPTRPVTMVVPFAAGGPVDVLGRILAQYLGEAIGKQVIVDNVPGGGGMTGSLRVSQAAPDGYMFVLASIGTHALNQTLSKKPLYNAATDFVPVALIADVGLVLITRKDPDQGERREGGLIDSFVTKREQQMDTGVRHVHAHSRR
jgi:tripartite-type tricarboxylate transporter receptor subunit TctC